MRGWKKLEDLKVLKRSPESQDPINNVKLGQGQPRLKKIPRPNFDLMIHTKTQCHWPFGSWEDFKGFLPYMGVSVILVM